MQSRNPEGYFWDPTSLAYFQSQISSQFSFEIPNPESRKAYLRPSLLADNISNMDTLCQLHYIVRVSGVDFIVYPSLPQPPLFFFRRTELLSQTWVDGLQQESQTDQTANGESRRTLLIDLQACLN